MIVIRKRLILWLIKAYLKKSKKILILSFLSGLLIFFAIIFGQRYIKEIISFQRKPVIGIVGSYEQDKLPKEVVSKLSNGLTKINDDYSISTDLAESYSIDPNGKLYKFNLKKDIKFNDGSKLTSETLTYQFSDVKVEKPDKHTVIFKLNDAYSPFLTTISQPIFNKGHVGTGDFNIRDIKLNGSFVQDLLLSRKDNRFNTIRYVFYPTEEALKTAFALGEVTSANGISDTKFSNIKFDSYPKIKITPSINYKSLVTIFYNTTDSIFSDRKVRLGLSYAIPDDIPGSQISNLPYPKTSIYLNTNIPSRKKDLERAKILLPEDGIKIKLKVLKKYKHVAEIITKEWSNIGVSIEIEEVDQIPNNFQVFLGDFNVPDDPDQYALWHSDQPNNITKFKNLRIDKLLEDGRKTTNIKDRKKIYNDFQKFLLEEMPATFLYFPKEYNITRK